MKELLLKKGKWYSMKVFRLRGVASTIPQTVYFKVDHVDDTTGEVLICERISIERQYKKKSFCAGYVVNDKLIPYHEKMYVYDSAPVEVKDEEILKKIHYSKYGL